MLTRGLLNMKKLLLASLLVALLASASTVALANDENMTLAFLRYGQSQSFALTDKAVLDMLQVYGYINADERAVLDGGSDLHGENIDVLLRDAGFDLATASLMVEDALDEGADILLTVSTEVGMLAANAVSGMEEPPVLIFAIVTVPYRAGIASAPCVKPPNVTGTQMYLDFELINGVREAQNPDLQSFGLIVNPNDPTGDFTVEVLTEYAAETGTNLEVAAVLSAADYALATESLLDKGVEAIVLPPRTGSPSGIPSIADIAYGVPVYSVVVTDVFQGVTIGSGFQGWYREGVIAARMAIGHIRGELDIARTGINTTPGFTVAVNKDVAENQGVVIRDELLELADYIIEGGFSMVAGLELPGVTTFLEDMSLEERIAQDAEAMAGLYCTDEMIAEQQAALDASE